MQPDLILSFFIISLLEETAVVPGGVPFVKYDPEN